MAERRIHTITMAGAAVAIETNHAPWEAYLQKHFGPLLTHGERSSQAEVTVQARWEAQRWGEPSLHAEQSDRLTERLGGSIVGSDQEICWVQKFRGSQRLRLIAKWEGARLRIEGIYRRKVLKERMKLWMGASESQRLFELTYPLVYYPLWWYLESTADWHVLHASAVQHAGGTVVFAGLEGIGKTTLALAWAGADGQLIADNLIWYNATHVLGVPEPIRLHDPSIPAVQRAGLERLAMGATLKGFFRMARAPLQPTTPVAVVLPVLSTATDLLPIGPEACADRLLATNQLAGEVSAYLPFAAWMSFLRPVSGLQAHRRDRLIALLKRCRCGILRMAHGDVEGAVSRVRDWLKQSRPMTAGVS